MTITLKETDAVVIGIGWTGSIVARELTKAGLYVVGLERGSKRMPRENFTLPSVRDDLKFLTGEADSERLAKLERKFWALMRILAKKGLITKEEFLAEFDK